MLGTVAAGATGNGRKTPLEPIGRVGKLELAGLDTRFKHARLTATRGRRIEDSCGEYRRSLSFQLALFGQPPLEVHAEG